VDHHLASPIGAMAAASMPYSPPSVACSAA